MSGKQTGKTYWRSLDELADTPAFRAFVEREFPSLAGEMLSPTTRRRFLKMMGASLAMAGLAGCRWPEEKIVPHAHRPGNQTPGVPVRFATAMELGGAASGLLVTSYDGRPVKIEGNPEHPINRGATDAITQASLLELYDPDRSKTVNRPHESRGVLKTTWDEFTAFAKKHFGELREQDGAGLCILSEASSSPSVADMKARLLKAFPQARWHEYEPISWDNEREGTRIAFGRPMRPHLHLDQAEVIACFDADILMTHPAAVKHARDFAAGRTADDGRMNRLYMMESGYSITGSMADHRVAVPSRLIPGFLQRLDGMLSSEGADFGRDNADAFIEQLAKDLDAHRGRSTVIAGPQQPPEVNAVVHALNVELGNAGKTITYTAEADPDRPTHVESIKALAEDIDAGKVKTLVILGGNPAYNAPADLAFGELLGKVDTTIHLSGYYDETSQLCTWHLPRAHCLESWGDARSYDGTICTIQPLIAPLYNGKTSIELLALITGDGFAKGHDIVRRTMRSVAPTGGFERFWKRLLHDGLLADSAFAAAALPGRNRNHQDRSALIAPLTEGKYIDGLEVRVTERSTEYDPVEVCFVQDMSVYDGRFASNGWLQEMPDPMTKITWDNAALIAPETARLHHVTTGDVIPVDSGKRELEIPVYVMPGHAEHSLTLPLGYGRTGAGPVGTGVGVDTYKLRTTDSMHVARTGSILWGWEKHDFAATQDHHAIDAIGMKGRAQRLPVLIREANLDEYRQNPEFAREMDHYEYKPLWAEHEYEGRRWAMAIDLSKCTGCSACVVACQAENNIPVVGKEQVGNGREMHWLRIDRYFKGDPEDPRVVHQPVACHHCENAPCEQVCPVAATVHNSEGLNDMVYNRCIGTRYCSNNCPYKVRRFNYFNFRKDVDTEVEKMVFNPEVTIRSRGVMEKCTYCVQRIEAAKIAAKNERRPIADGEIVPACAQVCPTQAIIFGDLNDPKSRVRQQHEHNRAYAMLGELNVKPRTRYLARLRNPGRSET